MSSLWTSLCKLVGTDRAKQVQSKQRKQSQRRLRMEMLEGRALLAADIVGTVFHDINDNGIDAGDSGLAGVQVALFRDGGNGTYNSGAGTAAGGDDVLVGTATSDATGKFTFNVTQAGTYFVVQTSTATGLLQRESARVQTVSVSATDIAGIPIQPIDTFDDSQNIAANFGATNPDFSSVNGAGILGGQRDIFANATIGSVRIEVNGATAPNQVIFDLPPNSQGQRLIVYDGPDNDATTLDTTGLNNADLTQGGTATGFRFLIGGEAGTTISIRVHNGANSSVFNANIPVTTGGAPTAVLEVPFSAFTTASGSGVNFNSVGAIEFEVGGPAAADATIDLIETYGPGVVEANLANLSPMSIGDLVFADLNNNGLFEPSAAVPETGLPNIQLLLFEDTNGNGTFDAADQQVTNGAGTPRSTTTDANGNYLFDNLLPGNYFVVIPTTQFAAGAAAYGHVVSSTIPAGQSNNANTGATTAIAGAGVVTSLITLVAGAAPVDDGDTSNNTDLSNDIGLVPQYDLTIDKTSTSTSVVAGTTVTYTLNARNDGPASASGVIITDNIPDGLQIISVTSNVATDNIIIPPSAQDSNGSNPDDIRVEVGSLSASATTQRTITVVAYVLPDTVGTGTPATLDNTATIEGAGVELGQLPNTDTLSLPLTREAVLELIKTATPGSATVGSNITYTLTMRNDGPSTARNVVISDLLPEGLDLVSVTSNVGTAVGNQGAGGARDSIEVTVPNVGVDSPAVDTDVIVTIVATVLGTVPGNSIQNTATADSDDSQPVTDDATTPLSRDIDLAITKDITTNPASTSTPAVAPPNSTFTYTIIARNDGPSPATTVRVTDNLPDGIRIISATSSDPSDVITLPASAQDDNPLNPDDLIIQVGNLGVGAANQTTITIVGVVLPGTSGTITNVANIEATDNEANNETNLSNNSASVSANAPRTIDLAVTKNGPATAVSGNTITYTMTARNNGPSDATNVIVTDNIPDGLRIISASVNGTNITLPASATDTNASNPDDLVFNIGNLASGATNSTIQIVAAILPSTTAALINQAVISTTDTSVTESDTTNNTSNVTTTLTQQNDVAVVKTGPATIISGNQITYTMNVTNNGPSTATNVGVVDTLPAGLTFVSGSAAIGGSNVGTVSSGTGNTATVNIPSLNPGETAVVTVVANVGSSVSGTITNSVTVNAVNDTVPNNNTSTAITTVTVPQISNISGTIYLDGNRDGALQPGERGIPNSLVTLTGTPTGSSTPISRTTRTDENGRYLFENVPAGTYNINSEAPSAYRYRASNPGSTGGTQAPQAINSIPLAASPSTDNNVGYIAALTKRMFLASAFDN